MTDAERRRQPAPRRMREGGQGTDVPAEVDERIWTHYHADTMQRESIGGAREVLFDSANRPLESVYSCAQ